MRDITKSEQALVSVTHKWKSIIGITSTSYENDLPSRSRDEITVRQPKIGVARVVLVTAYQQSRDGNYTLFRELLDVMTQPYTEQSKGVED